MPLKYDTFDQQMQAGGALAQPLRDYVKELEQSFLERLDIRYVRTFMLILVAILQHRHPEKALVMSELGSFIIGPKQTGAGVKRIANFLACKLWNHQIVENFLLARADEYVDGAIDTGEDCFAAWDESVLEKPESSRLENLSPVRSSRAARLKCKPAFGGSPPGKPAFVAGMPWGGVILVRKGLAPVMALSRWWSTRAEEPTTAVCQMTLMFSECALRWGRHVVHLCDRGFGNAGWLARFAFFDLRFIVRWRADYKLVTSDGQHLKAGQIAARVRTQERQRLWDSRANCYKIVGVAVVRVYHESCPGPLYMVICRGWSSAAWYLLTNEPVASPEECWRIVWAYTRRWEIEQSWRFCKDELGIESVRIHNWENRLKLLSMALLVYAFMLTLLKVKYNGLVEWLLNNFCPRKGAWQGEVAKPLYRLRIAISTFWRDAYRRTLAIPIFVE